MGDKNVELMMEDLSPVIRGVVTTAVDEKRAMSADVLAERVAKVVTDIPVMSSDSVEQGLDMARAEAGPEGALIVTGSLYLVGKVRDLLT
jgi:dihydrofolate synthase/folylpolyglutamate synthase